MLMTFSKAVSRAEQLLRTATRRKHGRKHEHRIGPTRKTHRDQKTAQEAAAHKRHSAQVHAYWIGERETFPK